MGKALPHDSEPFASAKGSSAFVLMDSLADAGLLCRCDECSEVKGEVIWHNTPGTTGDDLEAALIRQTRS